MVAQKQQMLPLQAPGAGLGKERGQIFRLLHQKKVAAVFQRPGSGLHQRLRRAGVTAAGQRCLAAGPAPGKVGGIGHAAGKLPRREPDGYRPQVGAYTFHAVGKAIAADVLHGALVGKGVKLHPGDMAAGIPGAQQQPQGAAAGAKVQHPGIFG